MKMIIAIVQDEFSDSVSHALTNANFRVTTIASTGGFLRRGQTTLLCGLEDEKLEESLKVIRGSFPSSTNENQKRCTLFVVNVADYYRY